MNNDELIQWRKEFDSAPKIWWLEEWFNGERECTGNFYSTEEGAKIELAFLVARKRKAKIYSSNVHSDDLSRRRWT